MTLAELKQLREMKPEETDYTILADAEQIQIQIDDTLPPTERMLDYLEKIRNPYCFLCGKTPVRVVFAENETDLETRLKTYFLSFKQ